MMNDDKENKNALETTFDDIHMYMAYDLPLRKKWALKALLIY